MSKTVRSPAQPSLFGDDGPRQPSLFDQDEARSRAEPRAPLPVALRPDELYEYKRPLPRTREEHHAAMIATIEYLREQESCPWDAYHVRMFSGVFRNRSEWFPAEIAEPLLAQFAAEAERLDLANAPVVEEY